MVTLVGASYMPEGKMFVDVPDQNITVDRRNGLANMGFPNKADKEDEITSEQVNEDELEY
jgi:hypothetical protein